MEHVFIALFITLMLFLLSCAWDASYTFDPSLRDKKCVGADADFETDLLAGSSFQCASVCANSPSCKSVFYRSSPVSKCYGCKVVYNASVTVGLTSETGTTYYRPYAIHHEGCTAHVRCLPHSNQSCEDTLNVCVCTPGYSYDPTSGTCILTQECAAYGITFQLHARKFISGTTLDGAVVDTVDSCLGQCSNYTSCLSVNLLGSMCFLYSGTALTPSYQLNPSSTYDHYSRNCA